jgi:succinoglycan biosynthesis transport protein ExoP
MSIIQFLRILWAHRLLTIATTAVTLLGAFIAILIVPPSYEGKVRVMLNTLKPDPVTGEVIPGVATRTYITTQIELIRDFGVVGKAVDSLGWLSNPNYIAQYQAADNGGGMDMRRWLSQRIIDRTKVSLVNGTNILELTYRASSPVESKAMADALRNAYIDATLESRRADATRTANWYEAQALKEQATLNAADAAKTAFEKQNGIVMQADNTDVDTARLRALSSQGAGAAPMIAPPPLITSAAAIQLAQLDAAITQASQNLGPNHPAMLEMKARRATLAQVAANDAAAARAAAGAAARAAGAGAGALDRAVAEQTSKVIAKRDKIQRLSQLQAEVNLRRDQYTRSMARVAELRQQAAVADTGITALGDSVQPQKPTFPNKPLILGGAAVGGFALGILLSLLVELFARRVRGAEDLRSTLDVPLLAIVTSTRQGTSAGATRRQIRAPKGLGRRGAVQA